jgi:hypothetical protein
VGHFDYGPDAVFDLNGYITRWFDHFLKGVQNGVTEDPPVTFRDGALPLVRGEGLAAPPRPMDQVLPAELGKANTLNGDGLLTTTHPRRLRSTDMSMTRRSRLRSPWTGGHTEEGAVGEGLSIEVLVYNTPPLTEDV